MGLLNKLKDASGKAESKLNQKIAEELQAYLVEGETIEYTFSAKEDHGAVTSKRLLFNDKGLLTKKKTVLGVPLKNITSVGLKKGGFMQFSKEVVVQIGSQVTEIDTYNSKNALELFRQISARIIH